MRLRSNEKTLKEAIQDLVNSYRLKDKMQETRIVTGWEELMGKTIARCTQDVYLQRSTLVICLTNATVRNELLYSREKIKDMVNEFVGEELVKEVVVR
ncbi:MAG: DUF721 domain-containing protein [Chitinophagales bacterium]|nr:DUF721 domain-containing protein [Chitinophagales bacterium]